MGLFERLLGAHYAQVVCVGSRWLPSDRVAIARAMRRSRFLSEVRLPGAHERKQMLEGLAVQHADSLQ